MNIFDHPDGATPLDPNETAGLRLSHITNRGELNRWEQDNILKAHDWLARTKPSVILNDSFIKDLHRRMFSTVWKWAGKYRSTLKNIGMPAHRIPEAVRNLCDDAQAWVTARSEASDMIAVRFHHRLVSIHPFANGNGRHARLMADLILENVLGEEQFSWGGHELGSAGSVRQRYIKALQQADGGDLISLLKFVRT